MIMISLMCRTHSVDFRCPALAVVLQVCPSIRALHVTHDDFCLPDCDAEVTRAIALVESCVRYDSTTSRVLRLTLPLRIY